MCLVSVIVPLYKGEAYIDNIISMLEENAKRAKISIEVIFVNDYPEENIVVSQSEDIRIECLRNDCNKGIHFSRVYGLENANGKYVLFLDQDDQIEENYIQSQLKQIGSADVVICNGLNNGRVIYNSIQSQKCVRDLDTMINGNQIVSPGQALLKRVSIPREWRENILSCNCSDDYFLWLLILCQGKEIEINTDILYKHIYTGTNLSLNRDKICDSVNELMDLFTKWDYLSPKEIEKIRKRNYQKTGKYVSYVKVFDLWMQLMEKNDSFEKILVNKAYKSIAIYGMGVLGKHLLTQLEDSDIEIKYIIDQNKYVSVGNIDVITVGEEISDVDAIIVTPIDEYEEIKRQLEQFYTYNIISLELLLRERLC